MQFRNLQTPAYIWQIIYLAWIKHYAFDCRHVNIKMGPQNSVTRWPAWIITKFDTLKLCIITISFYNHQHKAFIILLSYAECLQNSKNVSWLCLNWTLSTWEYLSAEISHYSTYDNKISAFHNRFAHLFCLKWKNVPRNFLRVIPVSLVLDILRSYSKYQNKTKILQPATHTTVHLLALCSNLYKIHVFSPIS